MTILQKHFSDLMKRAEDTGIPAFSSFLGLAEQDELKSSAGKYRLSGGYESAERLMACFGGDENTEYPIAFIQVKPKNMKFADKLTHRDFLGSLMNLGIERDTLGDIIIKDNCGYIICTESIAEYIIENLQKVRHTYVVCERSGNIPENSLPEPEYKEIIVSSPRLDAIVSALYKMSRNESKKLFIRELVFVNGIKKQADYTVKENDIISVRGYGRLEYEGVLRETAKGRQVIGIKQYK